MWTGFVHHRLIIIGTVAAFGTGCAMDHHREAQSAPAGESGVVVGCGAPDLIHRIQSAASSDIRVEQLDVVDSTRATVVGYSTDGPAVYRFVRDLGSAIDGYVAYLLLTNNESKFMIKLVYVPRAECS